MRQPGNRLLLVDADRGRAERLARRLAGLSLEIELAENGAEALLRVHARRPDVIVTTAELPVLNGFLMLEGLRSQPATADVPVILLTEGYGHEELARGWKAGADLCIPRQHGDADVLATLHRALESFLLRTPEAHPPDACGTPVPALG